MKKLKEICDLITLSNPCLSENLGFCFQKLVLICLDNDRVSIKNSKSEPIRVEKSTFFLTESLILKCRVPKSTNMYVRAMMQAKPNHLRKCNLWAYICAYT